MRIECKSFPNKNKKYSLWSTCIILKNTNFPCFRHALAGVRLRSNGDDGAFLSTKRVPMQQRALRRPQQGVQRRRRLRRRQRRTTTMFSWVTKLSIEYTKLTSSRVPTFVRWLPPSRVSPTVDRVKRRRKRSDPTENRVRPWSSFLSRRLRLLKFHRRNFG